MTECAPEMPLKSALVPMGAESVRRCSSVPSRREGAHFGAGLIHPGQLLTLLIALAEPDPEGLPGAGRLQLGSETATRTCQRAACGLPAAAALPAAGAL